jgi:monofunctional biosynthetic peptidoglycan transglycosylase
MQIKRIYTFFKKIITHFFLECISLLLFFIVSSISLTVFYKYHNPKLTYLMVKRANEYKSQKEHYIFLHEWIDLKDLSSNTITSVIYAEDPSFYLHKGVNFKNVLLAYKQFRNRKPSEMIRGYSTISQQTAKNIFLYPKQTILRKILEIYFTYLIETVWGKRRILEIYLNMIEWGDSVYGIKSSSIHYFNKDPSELSLDESILLS